jgi:hypothetical protein
MQHQTNLNLDVEVEFDIIPPLDGPDIPLQADITGVYIRVPSSQNKSRRVNILTALSESEVLAIEDEILTPEFVQDYFRFEAWRNKRG